MKILEYSEKTFYIQGKHPAPLIYYTIGADGTPQIMALRNPIISPTIPATKLPSFFTRDILKLVFSEMDISVREVLYNIVLG